ncbi:hypothetical protein NEPAR06_0116 [Nematocida parisii]|nr:hypothetical protein NEPAR07_2280 [Nematocida parisii]KAI5152995.1 hypothetical protein NEPAR06_0116 [Nematocida parisii]KAI5157905.1 hypothetical protein NEPAR05_1689 [Nematocida parisii]
MSITEVVTQTDIGIFSNSIPSVFTNSAIIGVAAASLGVVFNVAMLWLDILQKGNNPNISSVNEAVRNFYKNLNLSSIDLVRNNSLMKNVEIGTIFILFFTVLHLLITHCVINTVLLSGEAVNSAVSTVGLEKAFNYPNESIPHGFIREDSLGHNNQYNVSIKPTGALKSIFSYGRYEIFMAGLRSCCLITFGFISVWLGSVVVGYILPDITHSMISPVLTGIKSWVLLGLTGLQVNQKFSLINSVIYGFMDWMTVIFFIFKVFFTDIKILINVILSLITALCVIPTFYSLIRVRRIKAIRKSSESIIYTAKVLLSVVLGICTLLIMLYPIRIVILMYPSVQDILKYPLSIILYTVDIVLDRMGVISECIQPVQEVNISELIA